MALAALPRRDAAAREHLDNLGRQSRPVVLARDRAVGLSGDLGELIPGGALVRGSVLCVESDVPGAGSTSVAFELAAAVTAVGEWAAAIDLDGTLGALAGARRGRGARSVRGGPAGSPLPLGHRGRGPARRREPRAGRGAARDRCSGRAPVGGTCPRTRGDPRGVRAGGSVAGRRRAHAPRREQCVGRSRRCRLPHGAARCTCTSRVVARPCVRRSASSPVPSENGRVCCLWCPDWPVVAARARAPELHDIPVAVVGSNEPWISVIVVRSCRRRRPKRVAKEWREVCGDVKPKRGARSSPSSTPTMRRTRRAFETRGARGRTARASARARPAGPLLVLDARSLALLRW